MTNKKCLCGEKLKGIDRVCKDCAHDMDTIADIFDSNISLEQYHKNINHYDKHLTSTTDDSQ